MIMTVKELRQFITTEKNDQVLGAMLQALELSIRGYTHNSFQIRSIRSTAHILDRKIHAADSSLFSIGDTVQITDSDFNNGLYTITEIDGNTITVDCSLVDERSILITKVKYPADIKMGIVNLLNWDLEYRDKASISSETISRHSVTYNTGDSSNSYLSGYPASLMGFLKPYMKARF